MRVMDKKDYLRESIALCDSRIKELRKKISVAETIEEGAALLQEEANICIKRKSYKSRLNMSSYDRGTLNTFNVHVVAQF